MTNHFFLCDCFFHHMVSSPFLWTIQEFNSTHEHCCQVQLSKKHNSLKQQEPRSRPCPLSWTYCSWQLLSNPIFCLVNPKMPNISFLPFLFQAASPSNLHDHHDQTSPNHQTPLLHSNTTTATTQCHHRATTTMTTWPTNLYVSHCTTSI